MVGKKLDELVVEETDTSTVCDLAFACFACILKFYKILSIFLELMLHDLNQLGQAWLKVQRPFFMRLKYAHSAEINVTNHVPLSFVFICPNLRPKKGKKKRHGKEKAKN